LALRCVDVKEEFEKGYYAIMPKFNMKENRRIVHNFWGCVYGCNTSCQYFSSKIPVVGIKNSWSFKLLKDYLANRKFEEDTLCPRGLYMTQKDALSVYTVQIAEVMYANTVIILRIKDFWEEKNIFAKNAIHN
jgi:hypothetical protein